MNHHQFYSIIVPSYNRAEEIQDLLESFRTLDFPPEKFELIIADDGSTDETARIVKAYREQFPFALHFYRQENQGPGKARNMGMTKAKGDFFIFIDSDCSVSPGWLRAIDRALDKEQADAFGGPDSFREDFPPLLKAINYSMTSFITTGGIRGHKPKSLGKYYPRSFNMGLSRSTYLKIGGFGKLRHGQDIEYSHRIIAGGVKVILIPEAVVYHKRRTSFARFFRQVFNWGVARINLYKIDPKLLEFVHALPAIATAMLMVLLAASLFSAEALQMFKWLLLFAGIILIASGIHAAVLYHEIRQLYLVPLIMPIQIIGYGLGFLTAFISRVMLKREEFSGFRKKYY